MSSGECGLMGLVDTYDLPIRYTPSARSISVIRREPRKGHAVNNSSRRYEAAPFRLEPTAPIGRFEIAHVRDRNLPKVRRWREVLSSVSDIFLPRIFRDFVGRLTLARP
jgi:hypothetical protein